MRLILVTFIAASLATASNACGISPSYAIIHSALPPNLPKDTFVAFVDISSGNSNLLVRGKGLRARVRQVVQGDPNNRYVLLENSIQSSCDSPFLNGRSGYIVAVPRKRRGGILIVDPILVSQFEGFRLPDDFVLTEAMRSEFIEIDEEAFRAGMEAGSKPRQ